MATPLRVAHVVRSDSFAGVERSVVLSAQALARRGHRIVVIGGHPGTMTALLDGVPGVTWRPAASVPEVVRELARLGRLDVVHAHMTAAEVGAIATGPRNRAALVFTRHFGQPRGRSRSGRAAAWLVGHRPHIDIAISDYVAGLVEGPSVVVHHGLDDVPAVEATARRVVVIQRLEPEKQTAVALRAWGTSGLGDEGWELVLAGDGSERPDLEALAAELGINESVRFLGRVEDVGALRATASIQLATPPGEHFGLSVLEAMACGLPVVATRSGAHPELLGPDREGGYFADGDASAAATELRRLADDTELRRRIAASQQARQRELYSLESHASALEAVYRSVVRNRS